MEDFPRQLDARLRAGDAQEALAVAAIWASAGQDNPRDTAIEIARVAGAVYRDLVAQPVHDFRDGAEAALPGSIGPTVAKALGRLVDLTLAWEPKLRACHEERLARELRDCVRFKDWAGALRHVAELAEPTSKDPEEGRQRANYVGAVLGTLVHQPREAEYLEGLIARDPEPLNLTPELAAHLSQTRLSRHQQMLRADLANLENQWTQTLRSTQAEILGELPHRNKMGEPDDNDMRVTGDLLRTILRIPLWRHDDGLLPDATLLLADFLPYPSGGRVGHGVEGRAYARMGYRARKATAVTFQEIGRIEHFTRHYMQWGAAQLDKPYRDEVVELMGALRCEAYGPRFVEWWKDKKLRDLRPELALALGNLATPEAANILLEELEDLVNTRGQSLATRINQFKVSVEKGLDEGTLRRSRALMASLGRIVRSPRTTPEEIRRVTRRAIGLVPAEERDLAASAAMHLVVPHPEAVDEAQRAWAANALADAMWVQDQTHALQQEGERVDSELGARAPLARALVKIAETNKADVLAALERHAVNLSGAYLAAAEVLRELKDPAAVEILSRMATIAMLEDVSAAGKYQAETIWDPAARERAPLTPDKLLAALVYSLGAVGGPEAKRALEAIRDRIASGKARPPGPETLRQLEKHVGLPDQRPAHDPRSSSAKVPRREPADPKEVAQLVKALTGSHLLASAQKKAQIRIQALARLGQILPPEAMEAVKERLSDKNIMVRSAAVATYAAYAAPGEPPEMLAKVFESIATGFRSEDEDTRRAAASLLKELGPHRPDVRRRVAALAETLDRAADKDRLRRMLDAAGFAQAPLQPASVEAGGERDENLRVTQTTRVDRLAERQACFKARQQWIAGGRKGEEPKPPPGAAD